MEKLEQDAMDELLTTLGYETPFVPQMVVCDQRVKVKL